MPVTHAAAGRSGPARARGRVRRLVPAALIAVAAAAGPLAVTPQALAQGGQAHGQLSVAIESVSPQWARPRHTVTVSGIVHNGTRETQQGLSVQLRSSASPLAYEDDLSLYASGDLAVDTTEGLPVALPSAIPPGHTVHFQVTLDPASVGMSQFGVYPLAAQVVNSLQAPLATDRTFLPYWQGNTGLKPKRLKIGWLWPILGQPEMGACRALLTNGLAASVASGGRLAGLLDAGRSYSSAAQLTWAIDPALARTAQAMSHPYTVQTHASCTGARAMPADSAARTWLTGLTGAISGQQAFVTPYADVDVAALSHNGLDTDLRSAFAQGRAVGSKILQLPVSADSVAWPQDGLADAGVLGSLAVNGIDTVVLDSTVMPPKGRPLSYSPSAQASADTQVGSPLRVLLSDHTISQLLATPATGPGSTFATEQRFLAQTAMIVAQLPNTARSLVVAPPRLWAPAPGLASGLLKETVHAPWLRPTSLPSMAAQTHPNGQVQHRAPPAKRVSKAELSPSYLSQVRDLGASIALQASIFTKADPGYLSTALAALESVDWPGSRAQSAAARLNLLDQVQDVVAGAARKVGIIDSGRQITLSGSSGRVPVSIFNGLHTAVRVTLRAAVVPANGRLSIGPFKGMVTIGAGGTATITLPVHTSTVGATELTLSLVNASGKALPGTAVELPVHATRFGTLALVILSVALALFILASFGRAVRRSRRDGGQHGPDVAGPPGTASRAGSVSSGEDLETDDPPEDPDEYADARGRARR